LFEPAKKRVAFHYLWTLFSPWSGISALGALFAMIPGLNILVMGYALSMTRRTFISEDIILPPWHNLWHLFKEGLKVLAVMFAISGILVGFSYLSGLLLPLLSQSTGTDLSSFVFLTTIISILLAILAGYFMPAIMVLLSLKSFSGIKYKSIMEIAKSWRYAFTVIVNALFTLLLVTLFAGIRPLYGSAGVAITFPDFIAMAVFTWWMTITSFTLFGLSAARKQRALIIEKILKKKGKI